MADDLRDARWKALRKLTIEQALLLLHLRDDLQTVGDMSWYDSLANRMERGQHFIAKHHEVSDEEAQEAADEMASGMRQFHRHAAEMLHADVTLERLQEAEDLLRSKGVDINLVGRLESPDEIALN